MSALKKLPVGIQAFETFARYHFLYVDKTEHIFRLTDEGMFYFLSRPRRFGKSLSVSVLRCLFQAKKELFEGLSSGSGYAANINVTQTGGVVVTTPVYTYLKVSPIFFLDS